jgi:hypothetical protein
MITINDKLDLKKRDIAPSGHKLAHNPLGHLVGMITKCRKSK